MNTHTRFTNTNFTNLDDLLEQQLIDLTTTSGQVKQSGPPGELVIDPVTEAMPSAISESSSPGDIPFLNLDPYNTDGKGDLPDFSISSPDPDYINWELGGTPDQLEHDLGVFNATVRSDDATIQLEGLSETRVTEVQYSHLNGQQIAIEWQNAIAHEVSGSIDYMNQGTLWLNSAVEINESVQAERFVNDGNGNITQELSAYEWGFDMVMDGEAHSYGIDTFEFEFAINISIEWDAEMNMYFSDISVEVVYTIEMLDGRKIEDEAFQEGMGYWSDLDLFAFEFNDDILDKLSNFQRDMGTAWDAIESFDDHMQALLMQLKDDGYYDLYDSMDGGIDNPFDFDLPNVDPFS